MDSNLLIRIHTISVMLFLLTYVIKTILLFSNKLKLERYTAVTKVPEMIISLTFLVTGIWLFVIIGGIKYMQIVKLILVVASIPLAIIGFKKMKKGIALLSLFMIVAAYGIAEMSKGKMFIPRTSTAMEGNNSEFAAGAVVFQQHCVFCHGADGKKMYRNAPDLTLSRLPEDAIIQAVRDGSKGKMPAYVLAVSDENISAVAKFVRNMELSDTTAH
jgi:mono/diheme cytochrome c family protein